MFVGNWIRAEKIKNRLRTTNASFLPFKDLESKKEVISMISWKLETQNVVLF